MPQMTGTFLSLGMAANWRRATVKVMTVPSSDMFTHCVFSVKQDGQTLRGGRNTLLQAVHFVPIIFFSSRRVI